MKFNIKPSQGREFLVKKKIIQGLPSECAQFIFDQNSLLNKRRIGEYIGKADMFNQQVCDALMFKYNFQGQTLDNAIRYIH